MSLTRRVTLLAALGAPLLAAGGAVAQAGVPASPSARPTLAVETFEGSELTAGSVAASSLVAILTDIILEAGHFTVIEAPGTGARFLLRGAIIRFDAAAGGAGLQVGGLSAFGRRAGAGARTKTTTVGLSMRLIEAASGQVVAAAKAEGSASGQEADAGLMNNNTGATTGATAFRGTPAAKAFEMAMRKTLEEITRKAGALG